MTGTDDVVLVGRSSSHFTRTARIFAVELGVPYGFQPVFDLGALDPSAYAENPALKIPTLLDAAGPLFGTQNICRELTRRSGLGARVVLRGEVSERTVANAEELVLHAMDTGVTLLVTAAAGANYAPPPKMRRSLENALTFLEAHVERVVDALPADRILSFAETALFCLITHLPFRRVMDVDGYPKLRSFCDAFCKRAGATATEYHFDSPAP